MVICFLQWLLTQTIAYLPARLRLSVLTGKMISIAQFLHAESEIQKEIGSFHDFDAAVLQLNAFRLVPCDNDEFLCVLEG